MRYLQERFTDREFEELKQQKGERSWRDAILDEFGVEGE